MNEKTHIDLFSGIGGFALAAGWAGFRTVAFCEIDPYCQAVLKERFGAIADAGGSGLEMGQRARTHKAGKTFPHEPTSERPSLFSDIREFDGTRYTGATLLTGGFPCQPFSVAGKRRGREDDRWLWPEMLRVISEIRPHWIIAENVTGIVRLELGQVLFDLGRIGYDFPRDHAGIPIVPIVPACALNAPHQRKRVWIIAKDAVDGRGGSGESQKQGDIRDKRDIIAGNEKRIYRPEDSGQIEGSNIHVADAEGDNLGSGLCPIGPGGKRRGRFNDLWGEAWPEIAARFCGMDDGIPVELDRARGIPIIPPPERKGKKGRAARLKALGNSIVPQIAYEIMKGIAEIENE